jgi:hypothetical protein
VPNERPVDTLLNNLDLPLPGKDEVLDVYASACGIRLRPRARHDEGAGGDARFRGTAGLRPPRWRIGPWVPVCNSQGVMLLAADAATLAVIVGPVATVVGVLLGAVFRGT